MTAASGLGSTFDSQPALKGDLVELRPLRPSDYEDLYAVACDPLLWEQHPDNNRHEAQVFRKFFDEALTSGGALLVIDARTQKVIGSSRFHDYDKDRSQVEIGWTFLARSHWGGKYNRELKQLMLGHAFRFVQSVIFLVGLQNFRSQRALEKIGAVRAGQRPNAIGRDSYVYQINRRLLPEASSPMRLLDFSTVAPREVAPGYLGRYLHSDHITQGRVDIAPDAVIGDHSHPHEQWTLLLSGSFELTVSGVAHVMRPGQMLYIAPHERHSARALTACVVLDVFHPPRDDYR